MSNYKKNAVIMAAGMSSRLTPVSLERPKGLLPVRGEILIERQIEQLQAAQISDICVVVGYKKEQFSYLAPMYNVEIVTNPDYEIRNNNGSLWVCRDYLHNTYICSSDNYYLHNLFSPDPEDAYYSVQFSSGRTAEWCVTEDDAGHISSITIGGENSWYMIGHALWDESFSQSFIRILEDEYDNPDTFQKLWEKIYSEHLDELKLRMRKYPDDPIYEFDTLDDLKAFDPAYDNDDYIVSQNI